MVFSSPVFVFVFLPACLLAALVAAGVDRTIAAVRARGAGASDAIAHPVQNLTLLAFSSLFYIYGSGNHVLIMLGAVLVSWLAGVLMGVVRARFAVALVAVAAQLIALGVFKYLGFFLTQASAVAELFGVTAPKVPAILLPIGISFFIFQSISYVIDVYRHDTTAQKNPLALGLYIMLFPQLIAGPIVRYTHVERELATRRATIDDVARGAVRFIYGLAKKVLVADSVAQLADAAFGLPVGELTTPAALLGAMAYTFQIYFDFSAYSDMAIGLGHMFGFKFPENFNRPLTATSITDFWRRWHITLSTFFRDYVYLPLGGSRGSAGQTYRNLWIVFLLSGLWHGASWTFVAWGAFHGALLTIERRLGVNPVSGPTWRRGLTFVLVVVGFTLFRAETFGQALAFYQHIVVPLDWSMPIAVHEVLTHKNMLVFALASASLCLPLTFVVGRFLESADGAGAYLVRLVVVTIVAVLAAGVIASSNFSPFIYFRF